MTVKRVARQKRVVRQGKFRHGPVTETLLGHVAQALGAALGRIEGVDGLPEELDRALALAQFAHANAQKARLAVARNAGNAHDFAAANRQIDVRQTRDVVSAVKRNALELKGHFAGRARGAHELGRLLADHQTGQILFGLFLGIDRFDHAAGAQNRAAVGELANFIELVGNKENRDAFGGELFEGFKKLAHGLRRQNRRWLVQDEQLGIAHKGADDFHALPLAHRQIGHDRVRVDGDAVALAQGADALGAGLGRKPLGDAQYDVLGDRERFEHRKVLVHHGDAQAVGLRGTRDLGHASVELNRSLIGRHRPEDDFHEGGLTGAVFAENRQHLTRVHFQTDVVVGDDARIGLHDVIEPKSRGHLEKAFVRRTQKPSVSAGVRAAEVLEVP